MRTLLSTVVALVAGGAALTAAWALADDPSTALPKHHPPIAKHGGTVVQLCDGETSTEIAALEPGQTMSPGQAKAVADDLMTQWKARNPKANWDADTATPGATTPSKSASALPPAPANVQKGAYVDTDARDDFIRKQAVDAVVAQGNQIFHSDKLLGGTVAISCDMCHPNAANTHPETYPKYQAQLQRVVLLRDMINWCIENPVRGTPLKDDDPKLKALEAYILAQRAGVPLAYGKH